jgi:hypothetical protein
VKFVEAARESRETKDTEEKLEGGECEMTTRRMDEMA